MNSNNLNLTTTRDKLYTLKKAYWHRGSEAPIQVCFLTPQDLPDGKTLTSLGTVFTADHIVKRSENYYMWARYENCQEIMYIPKETAAKIKINDQTIPTPELIPYIDRRAHEQQKYGIRLIVRGLVLTVVDFAFCVFIWSNEPHVAYAVSLTTAVIILSIGLTHLTNGSASPKPGFKAWKMASGHYIMVSEGDDREDQSNPLQDK